MTIASVNSTPSIMDSVSTNLDPLSAQESQADKRFSDLLAGNSDDPKDILADVTKQGAAGYWAWKIKELKKQIAGKTMQDMNLTPEKIAAMDPKTRMDTENKIMQIVEQQVKLAIKQEMEKKTQVMLSTSASKQALLNAAQGVGADASLMLGL